MAPEVVELPPVPYRTGIRAIYAKPVVQVALVSAICMTCPGMYNALSGIGGGGQVNADASNKGAVALYSCFAVTSFFSGTINNRIGSRLTLSLGALGYALYIGSFLSYNINQGSAFVIAAGAILGICAGLLWTAQGALTLAYATEQTKGRYFALFWAIFNLGAVLGNAIQLGLSWDSVAGNLSNSVYIAFLVITSLGSFVPFLLVDPATMVREDGSRVVVPVHPSWRTEFKGMYKCLRFDPMVVLLFPYFLASNWPYTWQFNNFNGSLFTLRTRALNSLLYYFFQIFGALAVGFLLDLKSLRRRIRAWGGLIFVFVLGMAIWGGSYHYQTGYTRESILTTQKIDVKDGNYAGHVILYILMGFMDAVFQNYAYWLIGSMSNRSGHLAYLVGFYKAIQSAGAAGVFRLDLNLTPFMTMLAIAWGLYVGSCLLVAPVIQYRVTDRTEDDVVVVVKGQESDGSMSDTNEKMPA